jgi:hypothetical protein
MVILKLPEEIERARASNRIVAEVLSRLREKVKPGVKTKDLDKFAEEIAEKRGARPHLKAIMVILTLYAYRSMKWSFTECLPSGFWRKEILSGLILAFFIRDFSVTQP